MKKIGILGSTGSIGTQTLDIVRMYPDRLQVAAVAAGSNVKLLEEQKSLIVPRRETQFHDIFMLVCRVDLSLAM